MQHYKHNMFPQIEDHKSYTSFRYILVLTGQNWQVRGRFLWVPGHSSAACSSCSASRRAGTAVKVLPGCWCPSATTAYQDTRPWWSKGSGWARLVSLCTPRKKKCNRVFMLFLDILWNFLIWSSFPSGITPSGPDSYHHINSTVWLNDYTDEQNSFSSFFNGDGKNKTYWDYIVAQYNLKS